MGWAGVVKILLKMITSEDGRKIILNVVIGVFFTLFLISSSPMIIFYALTEDGLTIEEVMKDIKEDFEKEIEDELFFEGDEKLAPILMINGIETEKVYVNEEEVITIYTVLANQKNGEPVIELKKKHIKDLKKVFNFMYSYKLDSKEITYIQSYTDMTEDGYVILDENGEIPVYEREVIATIKIVDVTKKTIEEAMKEYNFTEGDKIVLKELQLFNYERGIREANAWISPIEFNEEPFVGVEGWINPLREWRNSITSEFGLRIHPISGDKKFHSGMDIGKPKGEPVYSPLDGTVMKSIRSNVGYGFYIIIDHGGKFATLYGHLSKIEVMEGQKVKSGEKIAEVGTTGGSTGNHLHFEIIKEGEKINPRKYLK